MSFHELRTLTCPHDSSYLFYDVFRQEKQIIAIGPYYAIDQTPPELIIPTSSATQAIPGSLIDDNQHHTLLYTFPLPEIYQAQDSLSVTLVYKGFSFDLVLPKAPCESHTYALSSIMKNEHLFLPDWLAHHTRFGIDHFYLYDNKSDNQEQLQEILSPYKDKCTFINWDFPFVVYNPESFPIPHDSVYYCQIPQINHCLYKYRTNSKWINHLDLDEFLVSYNYSSIHDFMKQFDDQYNNISAIYLQYLYFGSNNIPTDQPPISGQILETYYKRAASYTIGPYISGKLICNPGNIIFSEIHNTPSTPHALSYINPDDLHINHYKIKSSEYNQVIDLRALEIKLSSVSPIQARAILKTPRDLLAWEVHRYKTQKVYMAVGSWTGLGNQLFQYASLWVFCFENERRLKLKKEAGYLLDGFPFIREHQGIVNSIDCKNFWSERVQSYDESLNDLTKSGEDVQVNGYFQDAKYFDRYADIIRTIFTFDEQTQARARQFLEANCPAGRLKTAIHLRLPNTRTEDARIFLYPTPSADYLSKTMHKYNQELDCVFIICSNDIERAKNMYASTLSSYHIMWVDQGQYDDMCIMSMCDHFILSSGTFGWWGAYLCPNANKKVTMSYPFFNPNGHGAHLNELAKCYYLKDWIMYDISADI